MPEAQLAGLSLYDLETERQAEQAYRRGLIHHHADQLALDASELRIRQLEAEILRRSHRQAHG